MSGGHKPKRPAPAAPAPTIMDAQVEAAKADIREKRKRAVSRRDTRLTWPAGPETELQSTLG